MKSIIAHIIDTYLDISATFIYGYITNLQKYKVILLTKETTNLEVFPFKNLYCAPRFRRYSLQWIWDKSCQKMLKRELYYEYIIKREKVRLIHAHFGPNGVRILRTKKRLGLPLITTFYGYDMSRLVQQKKWRKAYKKLFREGDFFLVEGSHMKRDMISLGCSPQKIKIQHIGVDINKFKYQERKLKNNDSKIRVLFCGRFTEKKGLIYGLKAIKIVTEKFPNLEFRIIGDGELRSEIEHFIKEENMQRSVVLLGYQPHYVFLEEAQKADILLQPSVTAKNGDSEGGAPTVLLEAQATGLPVISTYHADIPEVVMDGKSGFLVPERNPETIASKLEYLIKNPELWIEMGKYGRKHIEENYNIYKEVKKLEDIYSQFIRK